MKKGDVAELSAKWWKVSQPKGLATAPKLEQTLKAHEMAVAGLKAQPKEDQLVNALDTIEQVKGAVQKVIAEAAKAKANAEMDFTVQVLKKIDFAKESDQLKTQVKADKPEEDEDDPSALGDPKAFAETLRKSLQRLSSNPINWGFLCGKKPVQHRFLLNRTKNGRTVAQAAAKQLRLPAKVSFGTAIRSPEDKDTMILTVQGAMLAGLATRTKKMLVAMHPQPIKEVLLMVDGKIVPETVDPDDVDDDGPGDAQIENPALEALHARIAALEPRAAAAMRAQPATRDTLTTAIQQLMAAMEKEDVATAGTLLTRLEATIARLEAQAPPKQSPQAEGPGTGAAFQKLRLIWDGTRKYLQDQLRALEAAVVEQSADEPNAAEIQSNVAALEESLSTLDDSLSDALDDLYNAGGQDPALKQAARRIAQRYQKFVQRNPLMQELDANPFMPTDAKKRLDAAIGAIVAKV